MFTTTPKENTMARYNNILETIGRTPLVKLNALAPKGVNIYVKMESFNPMGSVKDRMASAVIEAAERSGELQPGQTVIEATSGNTGIALAMVCAQKGYPLVIVMAENFSVERRRLMRFLGARVVLTPAADKGTGMLAKTAELAKAHGYYYPRQFENETNADVHSLTTAQEILDDMQGEPLHYWVSGFGTGGTLKGVARRLKADSPATKIVVAEPDNSQVLGSGIPQPRDVRGKANASHPNFRPHTMQGWSPDFISDLTESAVQSQWVDEVLPVSGDDSLRLSSELATREGMLVGITSGATLAAALQLAERSAPDTNIICMLPDTGERYMSTPLFEEIPVEMTADEVELSLSTPLAQFVDIPSPDQDDNSEQEPSVDAPMALDISAQQFVAKTLEQHSVVIFALEWCEFCWSVRKLFSAMGLDYHSVDLDSVTFQANDRGGKIREVLEAELGVPTIPQIYIGGKHIGGATDLFTAFSKGEIQSQLDSLGVAFDDSGIADVNSFMPQWLQPRKSA